MSQELSIIFFYPENGLYLFKTTVERVKPVCEGPLK